MKVTNTDSIKRNNSHDGNRLFDRVLGLSLYFPSPRAPIFGHGKNGFVSKAIQNGKVWRMGCYYRLHRWYRNVYVQYYYLSINVALALV